MGSAATVVSAGTSRKARIASIFQHYYPEVRNKIIPSTNILQIQPKLITKTYSKGGWGIVLLCCVVLVQLLVHGFVLSYGVLVGRVTRRFRVSLVEAGDFPNDWTTFWSSLQHAHAVLAHVSILLEN